MEEENFIEMEGRIVYPLHASTQLDHYKQSIVASLMFLSSFWLCDDAGATNFTEGDISGHYSGSLSLGGVWSTEKPDTDRIFQGNANRIDYGSSGQFNPNGARTGDDGRLNFKNGDLVSSPITLMGEIKLNWRNYGVFIRGRAWYDYTLSNSKVNFGHSANSYKANSRLDDSHFDKLTKFQGMTLQEAYASGDFKVGNHSLNIRAGNQVIKWGEGLSFQNGIDSINPFDVSALHRHGSQLKVAVPMLYGKLGLSSKLSLESFYQLKWRSTAMESCGTYFSTNDYLPDGCFGVARGGANDFLSFTDDQYIHRADDKEPSDSGQFGFALRYAADQINTEFGAYLMNIHSRMPYVSLITDLRSGPGTGWIPGQQYTNVRYFADYPEDLHVYGLSFNSKISKMSVFGEYSFRPNQPVQLATGDLIAAFAGDPNQLAMVIGQEVTLGKDALNARPGTEYHGYDRLKVSQLSLGFRQPLSDVLGADKFILMGEVGMKYIHNLPEQSQRRYSRSDIYGSDLVSGNQAGCLLGAAPQYRKLSCTNDGYVSKFSWGYRLRAELSYFVENVGATVSPFLAFGQDIKGWSYDSTFSEGRLLGSIGVKIDYPQYYSTELSWTGSGKAPYANTDKDYFSLTLSKRF